MVAPLQQIQAETADIAITGRARWGHIPGKLEWSRRKTLVFSGGAHKTAGMYSSNLSENRLGAWRDSLFVDHAVFRLVWTNWAEVIPGKLYRSNHPTPARLAAATRRFGLRSLINLRGRRQCGSDALSREAAARLGLVHIDMAFESRGAPHRDRILRFHDIWRELDTPALMHCKSGADRAGLAAGLALMFEGGTAAQAQAQLGWRYGHFSQSRTGILDAFFRLYESQAEGRLAFLDWVSRDYDEKALLSSFRSDGLSNFLNDRLFRRE